MLNTFADGAGDLIIAPAGASRLRVGREIGRNDGAGKTRDGQDLSGKLRTRQRGSAVLRPVFGRMAGFAA